MSGDEETLAAVARQDVDRALAEDLGVDADDWFPPAGALAGELAAAHAAVLADRLCQQDLSAALIPSDRLAAARLICRESAVICGRPWVDAAFRRLSPGCNPTWHMAEGQRCAADTVVFSVTGPARALLAAERTAINFLQTLSAVATRTASFVDLIAGTRGRIVDTRKTLPGLRRAEKYAVRIGGGLNHRMGLYDAVLIKENHIAAAGGVRAALALAREGGSAARFVEIEVETLSQLGEALDAGASMILLDNMTVADVRSAVALTAGRAVLEVSGNLRPETVASYAQTGVDRLSIGSLTKDIRAVDFSLRFDDEPRS